MFRSQKTAQKTRLNNTKIIQNEVFFQYSDEDIDAALRAVRENETISYEFPTEKFNPSYKEILHDNEEKHVSNLSSAGWK